MATVSIYLFIYLCVILFDLLGLQRDTREIHCLTSSLVIVFCLIITHIKDIKHLSISTNCKTIKIHNDRVMWRKVQEHTYMHKIMTTQSNSLHLYHLSHFESRKHAGQLATNHQSVVTGFCLPGDARLVHNDAALIGANYFGS